MDAARCHGWRAAGRHGELHIHILHPTCCMVGCATILHCASWIAPLTSWQKAPGLASCAAETLHCPAAAALRLTCTAPGPLLHRATYTRQSLIANALGLTSSSLKCLRTHAGGRATGSHRRRHRRRNSRRFPRRHRQARRPGLPRSTRGRAASHAAAGRVPAARRCRWLGRHLRQLIRRPGVRQLSRRPAGPDCRAAAGAWLGACRRRRAGVRTVHGQRSARCASCQWGKPGQFRVRKLAYWRSLGRRAIQYKVCRRAGVRAVHGQRCSRCASCQWGWSDWKAA